MNGGKNHETNRIRRPPAGVAAGSEGDVPMASAADSSGKIPDPQGELINHLMHQKMTIGQYYEKVSPDVLKNMPGTLRTGSMRQK